MFTSDQGEVFLVVPSDSPPYTSLECLEWSTLGGGKALPHSLALAVFAEDAQPGEDCLTYIRQHKINILKFKILASFWGDLLGKFEQKGLFLQKYAHFRAFRTVR